MMATQATLAFILFLVQSINVVQLSNGDSGTTPLTPSRSPITRMPPKAVTEAIETTTEAFSPCPKIFDVWSHHNNEDLFICWTMEGNWSRSDANYSIQISTRNISPTVIPAYEDNCETFAFAIDEHVDFCVNVTWRHCSHSMCSNTTVEKTTTQQPEETTTTTQPQDETDTITPQPDGDSGGSEEDDHGGRGANVTSAEECPKLITLECVHNEQVSNICWAFEGNRSKIEYKVEVKSSKRDTVVNGTDDVKCVGVQLEADVEVAYCVTLGCNATCNTTIRRTMVEGGGCGQTEEHNGWDGGHCVVRHLHHRGAAHRHLHEQATLRWTDGHTGPQTESPMSLQLQRYSSRLINHPSINQVSIPNNHSAMYYEIIG